VVDVRRIWVLLSFFIIAAAPGAQAETIQLEYNQGAYMVPVRINGQMTIPFVLDTGASDTAIPADVFMTLLRTATVKDSDFVGIGNYVMAYGSEQSSKRFLLRELRVGNHLVKNVIANVVPARGDPLLGQTFLSRLPSWTVDNARHLLVLQDTSSDDELVGLTEGLGIKEGTAFFGRCRYQLVSGFFPCGEMVAYTLLKNGRSLISFWNDQALFTLSGGKDRLPNLENYCLSIDTLTMKIKDEKQASDRGMEGECHFRLNRDATKFFSIKCDVYNRSKGSMYNFYLEDIRKFARKEF
jgi:hypothetical protein